MKINSPNHRFALIVLCLFMGWLLSMISFYFTWGVLPDDGFLLIGALIYGFAALPMSFAYLPSVIANPLGEQTQQIVTFIFCLAYWPLVFYLIYKFILKGELHIFLSLLTVSLFSGYKWHYYAVGMSGI